jgi:hypothetical protein
MAVRLTLMFWKPLLLDIRLASWPVALLAGIWSYFLIGCQVVGPGTVRRERPDYNEAILKTNEQQTFVNMVRVYNHEDPLHMEITEVDVAPSTSGSLNGGLSPAGGPTQTGNVAGTLGYSEQTTIRIAPTLGAAEVSQLTTPITLDSLSNVIHSGYALGTILDLALVKLAPKWRDREDAISYLNRLWYHGGIYVGTATMPNPHGDDPPTNQKTSQQSASTPNALVIMVDRLQLRNSDLNCWRALQQIFYGAPDDTNNAIVFQLLSNTPVKADPNTLPTLSTSLAPFIEVSSAMGILRLGEIDRSTIFFTSLDDYRASLLHLFIIIQSAPAGAPLTPTISVGGSSQH